MRHQYLENMGRGKNLNRLRELDAEILSEVIREGEARLEAQFIAATAADQRALAWIGFIVTLAIASAGGSLSLVLSGKYLPLAIIGSIFSGLLAVSAFLAIKTVRPRPFCLPGNLPENWLPEEWEEGCTYDLRQARLEQAISLNNQIDDNAKWASEVSHQLSDSMSVAAISVLLAAMYSLGFVVYVAASNTEIAGCDVFPRLRRIRRFIQLVIDD